MTTDYLMGRIIGRRAIMTIFTPLTGIKTWRGAKKHIDKHHYPLRYTTGSKPMFYIDELIEYDSRIQALMFTRVRSCSPYDGD